MSQAAHNITGAGAPRKAGNTPSADETGVLDLRHANSANESVAIFLASPRLVVRNPQSKIEEAFSIKPGENIIGRDEGNTIVLREVPAAGTPPFISRMHASLILDDAGVVTLHDLKSRNGLFVNGERLAEGGSRTIEPSDRIGFGAPNHFRASIRLPHQMEEVSADARSFSHQAVGEKSLSGPAPLAPGQDQVIELQRQLRAVERQAWAQHLLLSSIQQAQDRDQMFQRLSEALIQIFSNADRCVVLTTTEIGAWTDSAIAYADGADQGRPITISRTVVNELQRTGEAILSNQVVSDLGDSESLLRQGVRSLMCCPFRYNGEIVGLVQLDSEGEGANFVLEDLKLLAQAAHVAELANSSAESRAEAERGRHMLQRVGDEQSMSFPEPVQSFQGVDAAFIHKPLKNAAGDFYDIIPLGQERTTFVLVDVSGHDSAAAIWGAEMKGRLNTAVQRIGSDENITDALPVAIAKASDEMHNGHKAGRFATGVVAVFNPADKTIEQVLAGHDPLLVYDTEAGKLITLTPESAAERLILSGDGINLPMGIADSTDMQGLYSTERYQMKTGDVVLGFTDGFNETENASGEQFGKDRLATAFVEAVSAGQNPEQILAHIHRVVTEYAAILTDDLSAFVLAVR